MNIRNDIRTDIIHSQEYPAYYSNGDDGDGVAITTTGTPYEVTTTITEPTMITSLTSAGTIDFIYLIVLSGSISLSLDGSTYPITIASGESISFHNLAEEVYLDGSGQVYFIAYVEA